MKIKILFISIILGFALIITSAFSDNEEHLMLADNEYKVITVKGQIKFSKSGKEMHRGDLYLKGTSLEFMSNESRAAIINEKTGRFILSGNTRGKFKILPSSNNISSRSGALLNIVDLKNHFDGRYLILDRMEVEIGSDAFPMDEDRYFYLKFKYKDEIIPKKLKSNGNFLIFDKEEIFKVDGKAIEVEEKEMTIYYKGSDKTLKISKFTPVFPDLPELKEEVDVLFSSMNKAGIDEKIDAVTSFLIDFYGRPYQSNLEAWLNKEFELIKNN